MTEISAHETMAKAPIALSQATAMETSYDGVSELAPEELVVVDDAADEDTVLVSVVLAPFELVATKSPAHLGRVMTKFATRARQVDAAAETVDSKEVDQSLTLVTHSS